MSLSMEEANHFRRGGVLDKGWEIPGHARWFKELEMMRVHAFQALFDFPEFAAFWYHGYGRIYEEEWVYEITFTRL